MQSVIWQCPPTHWVKLNIDSASKGNLGEGGAGGIIRNHNSNFLFAFATFMGIFSSIYAEAMAILIGVKHAKRLGISSLWVKSDSLALIEALNGKTDFPWSIAYVIRSLRTILKDFQKLRISHIWREGNSCADIMANWSFTNKSTTIFEDQW